MRLLIELQLEITPERWINKQVQMVIMNATPIISRICLNVCHGYNYFQVQKDVAFIQGRPLNRLHHIIEGAASIQGCSVHSSKYGTYVYIYIYTVLWVSTLCCVLSCCVLQTLSFWDSKNHKLFYYVSFCLVQIRLISRNKQDSDHCWWWLLMNSNGCAIAQ